MLRALLLREIGAMRPVLFRHTMCGRDSMLLAPNPTKDVQVPTSLPIRWLDIDQAEGRYLLAGGTDSCISVIDVASCKSPIEPLFTTASDEGAMVNMVQWFPHDSGAFVSTSPDGVIKLWDTNSQQVVSKFQPVSRINCASISPQMSTHMLIAVGTETAHVQLCDLRSGMGSHTLMGHSKEVKSVSWQPANEYILASGSFDQSIRLWDIRRAGAYIILDQSNHSTERLHCATLKSRSSKPQPIRSHNGCINSLHFSSDGHYLFSSGTDCQMRVWDPENGKNCLVNFGRINNPSLLSLQITSSINNYLVYHPEKNAVHAFNISTGEKFASYTAHFAQVNCCVYNPCQEELYSSGEDHQIVIWSPQNHRCNQKSKVDAEDTWSDINE